MEKTKRVELMKFQEKIINARKTRKSKRKESKSRWKLELEGKGKERTWWSVWRWEAGLRIEEWAKRSLAKTLGFVLSNLVVPPFRFVVTIFGETLGALSFFLLFFFCCLFLCCQLWKLKSTRKVNTFIPRQTTPPPARKILRMEN